MKNIIDFLFFALTYHHGYADLVAVHGLEICYGIGLSCSPSCFVFFLSGKCDIHLCLVMINSMLEISGNDELIIT